MLKKGVSGREQARTEEVRGEDIIVSMFGDILLQRSNINHKNMSLE